jgi:carbamoyl-phosphate synthase large subunit|tara:strand:+ start:583 stop:1695 length:1113 start_codon:yes stop_codon:yes gene_type:complete
VVIEDGAFVGHKEICMKKILVGGCGGAPTEGVINSLLFFDGRDEVIGMGSDPYDLILSSAKRKYVVPYATEESYEKELIKILNLEKPELIHCQNDLEMFEVSKIRDKIVTAGTKLFMPRHEVIDTCLNKYKTYRKWSEAGIKVPKNILINDEKALKNAFQQLANDKGEIWLRVSSIGAGGKGALPTNNFEFARGWIDWFDGWGDFVAAEMLTSKTVTWLSIWFEGKLVVAQTRLRKGWVHGNRTLSGVTGVTKVGMTYSDKMVDKLATDAISAIDATPHGIYGVDMAYDSNGLPNPTEINISRFFTTILFFTTAGLNMPKIFKDIALYKEFPVLEKKINPLPDGLVWSRGMDTKPTLMPLNELNKNLITL